VDDLEREYPEAVRARMALYHYGSVADGETLAGRGYRVVRPGESLALPEPEPVRLTAG
jgi:hypothetical protein